MNMKSIAALHPVTLRILKIYPSVEDTTKVLKINRVTVWRSLKTQIPIKGRVLVEESKLEEYLSKRNVDLIKTKLIMGDKNLLRK